MDFDSSCYTFRRNRNGKNQCFENKKGLSPLSLVCQAFVETLQIFPIFNSSLIEKDRLLIKKTVNLGIAVDTEQGLVVPVIKNTNEMSAKEMMEVFRTWLKELSQKNF